MGSKEENMLQAQFTAKETRLEEVKAELSIIEIDLAFLGDFPSASGEEEDANLLKKQKELQAEKQRLELEQQRLRDDLRIIEANLILLSSDQEIFRNRRND